MFFNAHDIDQLYNTIVGLINDSVSQANHGNLNKVCMNDKIIAKCLKKIIRSYRHLSIDASLHILRGSLEQLAHVKGGLNEYTDFFENNISALKSEHVVRSETDEYANKFVSTQYAIMSMCKKIVDSRIREETGTATFQS
tara:strand:+ start:142 stop:561 length:420 start_codon:yes stop_codon:yes gene_type:complete